MKRKQFFKICIVCLISIILLIGIYKLITTSLKVNQGKYRVADVVVTSTADIVSRTEENGFLSFDASQKNTIDILIVPSKLVNNTVTVENIEAEGNIKSLYVCQKDREEVLITDIQSLPIDVQYSWNGGKILIQLEVTNKNIVINKRIPENVSELRYDGTALKNIGTKLEDIKFDLNFDVKILDEDGTENILKVDLEFPNEKLLSEGYYVERVNLDNFIFKTK